MRVKDNFDLRFSEPELLLNKQYEAQAERKVRQLLKNLKGKKEYKNAPAVRRQILIWFQRLRQLVSHFLLVGHDLPKYLPDSDLRCLTQVSHEGSGSTSHDKLQRLCEEITNEKSIYFPPKPPDPSKKKKSAKFSFKKWMENTDGATMLSTKMRVTVGQIAQWLQDNPAKKIIVFAEFIDVLEHLKIICNCNGWDSTVFHGSLSPKAAKARSDALSQYRKNTHKQILLCSLELGGVGLNLTVACRVIIYDLWWNSAVEQQAFCRVYRVGQELETELVRFKVDDTIDDRLLKKQKEKEEEVKKCIKPEKGGVMQMLSTSELAKLVSGFTDADDAEHGGNDDDGDGDYDDDDDTDETEEESKDLGGNENFSRGHSEEMDIQSTSENSGTGSEDEDEMEEDWVDPNKTHPQGSTELMHGLVNDSSSLFVPKDDSQPTATGNSAAGEDGNASMHDAGREHFVDVNDLSFQSKGDEL